MPKMPIRMIALIMTIHDCPLGRLLGRGAVGRQELSGREGAAVYTFKGAQGTQSQLRLRSESRGPIWRSFDI